jgi:hypothetical protein
MHDVQPLCTSLGGTAQTAALAHAEHPVAVAVLPLGAWLEPALALPLIEIALDVTRSSRRHGCAPSPWAS